MLARAIAGLLIAVAALPAAAASAPRLEVAGNRLVDRATGTTFVPRGVNWPSFEYACFHGYGYSNSASPTSVGPTPAGAALIASWQINTVRVPLNQDCWLGDDGMPNFGTAGGYRAAVGEWVSILSNAGLAVILDLHWSAPSPLQADGQRAIADQRAADFWVSVAGQFKENRAIIFDAFNEPYSRHDGGALTFELTWPCWRDGGCQAPRANDFQPHDGTTFTTLGMQQLVDAIRSAGARQPIMLGGRDYANDLGAWLANRPQDGAPGTADDQLVASFHNYNVQACHTLACWNSTIAPIAAQVPVVTGELGQTDCRNNHLTSFMDWADQRGVGYLMWAWWVLADKPDCSELALLADVSGTPRAPNGTTLKAHLERPDPERPPVPSNEFSIGKVSLDRKRGTARLTIRVPGPGVLRLARTKQLKGARGSAAAAGSVRLGVRPRGRTAAKLARGGAAKVRARITYTPTGGQPRTKGKRLRLVRRR